MKNYAQIQTNIVMRLLAVAPTILIVLKAYADAEKEINEKWN